MRNLIKRVDFSRRIDLLLKTRIGKILSFVFAVPFMVLLVLLSFLLIYLVAAMIAGAFKGFVYGLQDIFDYLGVGWIMAGEHVVRNAFLVLSFIVVLYALIRKKDH